MVYTFFIFSSVIKVKLISYKSTVFYKPSGYKVSIKRIQMFSWDALLRTPSNSQASLQLALRA